MDHFFSHSIAITGGFASGKSTVAAALSEMMGYSLFDADKEVADLLKKNAPGWTALRTDLGLAYFDIDGELEKARLKQALFADIFLRKQVESVLHPLVRKSLKNKVDSAYLKDGRDSIIEVPLLFEANWQDDFSLVIVVSVSEEKALKRAVKRDGVTDRQVKEALMAQMPLAEKVLMAGYVIDNNESWVNTMGQLVELKKILDTRNLTA